MFSDLRFSDGVNRVLAGESSGGHLPSLSVLGHQTLLQSGLIYQQRVYLFPIIIRIYQKVFLLFTAIEFFYLK